MMPFGETVLAWRLFRGMTQTEVALAARLARPNLSAIERGGREVTLKTLRALALALGVRPGVLVDGVAPGVDSRAMDRAALERVAKAAASNKGLSDPRQATVAGRLRETTSARRSVVSGANTAARSSGTRTGDRAYFLLKISEGPETLASLVERGNGVEHFVSKQGRKVWGRNFDGGAAIRGFHRAARITPSGQ